MTILEEFVARYENSVMDNLDRGNFKNIISFLIRKKCDFIEDVVTDYLDLFTFRFEEFEEKYQKLEEKYKGEFLKKASENMELWEEFYNI